MANLFNSILVPRNKTSLFDLSCSNKLTFNEGDLVPIFCRRVVPGDKWKMSSEIVLRLAPTVAPVMSRLKVYTHHFYVPDFQLYDDGYFEKFIAPKPGQTPIPEPYFSITSANRYRPYTSLGSLYDYLGFQPFRTNSSSPADQFPATSLRIPALPYLVYQWIYDNYYRDENLVPSLFSRNRNDGLGIVNHGGSLLGFSGDDITIPFLSLRKRAWRKDYFAGSLPWPQYGSNSVSIPLGSASIPNIPIELVPGSTSSPEIVETTYQQSVLGVSRALFTSNSSSAQKASLLSGTPTDNVSAQIDPNGTLQTSVGSAPVDPITLNELRRANKVQEFEERRARVGSGRLTELLAGFFGVRGDDLTLRRPLYLGGGVSDVVFSEVLQTSSSETGSPLGTMGGHGISAQITHGFKRSFKYHGWIMTILSVMPETVYMRGVPREYLYKDYLDYYWPQFDHLGEQPVYNQEIFSTHGINQSQDEAVFGYVPRYAELKSARGSVHGDFLSSLAFWHQGRDFNTLPTLSEEFIYQQPSQRIWPVDANQTWSNNLWCNVWHDVKVRRQMSKYSTPNF